MVLPSFEPELGSRILDEIRRRVGESAFETWFEGLEVHPRRGGRFEVVVPTSFHRTYLSDRYQSLISDAAATVSGKDHAEIDFSVPARGGRAPLGRASRFADIPSRDIPSRLGGGRLAETPARPKPQTTGDSGVKESEREYTFARFHAGSANHFALAAAQSVAERPGEQYNPLFLHGGVGQGKTHLLKAITQGLRERGFQKVISISCAQFADEFIAAIADGKIEEFRLRYRNAEALLVDDVHFLESKNRTQEEFFHTFNALTNLGRQIVLTSDSPPAEISGLGERLVSRFRKGLLAPLHAPDLECRKEILIAKGREQDLEIPEDVAELIAKRVRENVRELEGIVVRLHSLVHLEKRRLDAESARSVLFELVGEAGAPRIDLPRIEEAIIQEYSVPTADLHSKKRNRSIVVPRQICMFLARRHTGASLGEIGLYFGGRDHTTVLHAIRKIEGQLETDTTLRRRVERVEVDLLRAP